MTIHNMNLELVYAVMDESTGRINKICKEKVTASRLCSGYEFVKQMELPVKYDKSANGTFEVGTVFYPMELVPVSQADIKTLKDLEDKEKALKLLNSMSAEHRELLKVLMKDN